MAPAIHGGRAWSGVIRLIGNLADNEAVQRVDRAAPTAPDMFYVFHVAARAERDAVCVGGARD